MFPGGVVSKTEECQEGSSITLILPLTPPQYKNQKLRYDLF